jgi:hypothetical protein
MVDSFIAQQGIDVLGMLVIRKKQHDQDTYGNSTPVHDSLRLKILIFVVINYKKKEIQQPVITVNSSGN